MTSDLEMWVDPELIPNLDELIIENNIVSEKQMRLLTEPLHAGWPGPSDGQPFVVMARVDLFYLAKNPAMVPDIMFAVGVRQGSDFTNRENLAYFYWLRGQTPDVVIEIVSNRDGAEETTKLKDYARIGIPYYVIFDPQSFLHGGVLRLFERRGGHYHPMPEPWFFEGLGVGLCLWQGRFEDLETTWLRWCDSEGKVIPTGAERAQDALRQVEELKARLRSLGIESPP